MLNDVFRLFQYLNSVRIVRINSIFSKLSIEQFLGKFYKNRVHPHYPHCFSLWCAGNVVFMTGYCQDVLQ